VCVCVLSVFKKANTITHNSLVTHRVSH